LVGAVTFTLKVCPVTGRTLLLCGKLGLKLNGTLTFTLKIRPMIRCALAFWCKFSLKLAGTLMFPFKLGPVSGKLGLKLVDPCLECGNFVGLNPRRRLSGPAVDLGFREDQLRPWFCRGHVSAAADVA
jgi:hypothetical protein